MKITILSPDASSNCLGRAFLLAEILSRHYEVEIVAPSFNGGKIWFPLREVKHIKILPVPVKRLIFFSVWAARKLCKYISGDIVYASKPMLASLGVGVLQKFIYKKPLVLDIDDWPQGLWKEYFKISSLRGTAKLLVSPLYWATSFSLWGRVLGVPLIKLADKITVSNNFLQQRYKGSLVPHVRNASVFNPDIYDRRWIREKFKIGPGDRIISFIGTPRPHKGIEDLIKALVLVNDKKVVFLIVGVENDSDSRHIKTLLRKHSGEIRTMIFPNQSFQKVPEFLAASDIVVIPQRCTLASVGQVPAKVFDAMAMAKPIVSTRVSDLPEILKDCGWIVEPQNTEELEDAIRYILDHPEEALQKGRMARKVFLEKFSYEAGEKVLLKMLRNLVKKGKLVENVLE